MALTLQPSSVYTTTITDSSTSNRSLTWPNSNGLILSINNQTPFTTTLTSAHTANRTINLPDKDCTLTDGIARISDTAQTLSGKTFVNFAVPAYAKYISVVFINVSTVSAGEPMIRFTPPNGTTVTSGYFSVVGNFNSTSQGSAIFTDGFSLYPAGVASYLYSGVCDIYNLEYNTWVFKSDWRVGDAAVAIGATTGRVELDYKLTTLNFVITENDTFDSGSVNVFYK